MTTRKFRGKKLRKSIKSKKSKAKSKSNLKSNELLIMEPQKYNKATVLNKNDINIKKGYLYELDGQIVTGSGDPWYVITNKNIKKGHKFHHNQATLNKLNRGTNSITGLRLLTEADILNLDPNYKFGSARSPARRPVLGRFCGRFRCGG